MYAVIITKWDTAIYSRVFALRENNFEGLLGSEPIEVCGCLIAHVRHDGSSKSTALSG